MSLDIRRFTAADSVGWDMFCEQCLQGTMLHSRKFLSYHENRFCDQSLIVSRNKEMVGLLPAAVNPHDPSQLVSHPGSTFGGILHRGGLRGETMIEALNLIQHYYLEIGYQSLIYKVTPSFYHRSPAQDDLYALYRLGASKIRCDLSSTIDLTNRLPLIKGRRWGIKKAEKTGVKIVEGRQYLSYFWEILTDNLADKHGASPVHTLKEIQVLAEQFSEEILCVCAELDGSVVAGTVLFVTNQTIHTQYLSSNEMGRDASALDAVIEYCISMGNSAGKRWFDFGISNENNGLVLNDSLYKYKNGFGGGGYTHEFYKLVF